VRLESETEYIDLRLRVGVASPPKAGLVTTMIICWIRASGGIGIHAWFRTTCRKAWRFESSLAHKTLISAADAVGIFVWKGKVITKWLC
jgi:hypothetical protein